MSHLYSRAALAGVAAAGLAAAGGITLAAGPTSAARAAARPATVAGSGSSPMPVYNLCTKERKICYSPQTLRAAYDADSLIRRGTDGRGETVVLLEPTAPSADSSTKLPPALLSPSVSAYDRMYHLAAAKVSVDTRFAPGSKADLASGEEVLDVDMVRAMAPGAAIQIDLFTVNKSRKLPVALPPVLAAAASQGQVISMSFGADQHCWTTVKSTQAALALDARKHVSVFASAGDDGAAGRNCAGAAIPSKGLGMPGSDPLVTAVGGTALTVAPGTGAYRHEVVWSQPSGGMAKSSKLGATGGGFSTLFGRPAYQDGVPGISSHRGDPDVAV